MKSYRRSGRTAGVGPFSAPELAGPPAPPAPGGAELNSMMDQNYWAAVIPMLCPLPDGLWLSGR
jgi:hypothetical protein